MRTFAVLFFLLTLPVAAAQPLGETMRIAQPTEADLYLGAGRVEVQAPVRGDVVAAARAVTVAAPVSEDLIAAGDTLEIRAQVGDDVRIAGREVRLGSAIGGHLVAAGETVTLTREARVASFAWIAGQEVVIEGAIAGPLKVAGNKVWIRGHVAGDAEVMAERLELLPGARIDGNLTWSGGKPQVTTGARIGGEQVERPADHPRPAGAVGHLWGELAVTLAFATAAVILFLLFPHAATHAAAELRRRPGVQAAIGLAVLFLTPVIIVLLFITGIGAVLALLLMALYLAALASAALIGAYAVTDLAFILARRRQSGHGVRAAGLVVVVFAVGLLQEVPLLGGLLLFLLVLWGVGAIAWLVFVRPPTGSASAEA